MRLYAEGRPNFYTVLVRDIPPECSSNEMLKQQMGAVFGEGEVVETQMVLAADQLQKFIKARDNVCEFVIV